MNIEVYGKENCGHCTRAKTFLNLYNIPFDYYSIPEEISAEEAKKLTGYRATTVPIIFVEGEWIGGAEEIEKIVREKIESMNRVSAMLQTGVHEFSYRKKNGELRKAIGTLSMEKIPEEARPKSVKELSENVLNVRYYDSEKNGWRMFHINSFEGFYHGQEEAKS